MFSSVVPPSNGMSFWLHDHERKKTVDCSSAFKRRERRLLENEPLFRTWAASVVSDTAGTRRGSRPGRAASVSQHHHPPPLELGLAWLANEFIRQGLRKRAGEPITLSIFRN